MYLSLKWKALLFLSMVLVLLTTTWIWQTTNKTLSVHHQQQQEKLLNQQHILNKILDERFQQLSPLIQLLSKNKTIEKQLNQSPINKKKLKSNLDELWFQLSLSLNADYIGIYNSELTPLAYELNLETIPKISEYFSLLLNRIKKKALDKPYHFIYCGNGCMQVVIEPVLLNSGKQVYIALGQNLAYLTQLFTSFSTDKLGILLPKTNIKTDATKQLVDWKYTVWALSDFDRSFKILAKYAKQKTITSDNTDFKLNQHEYSINTLHNKNFELLGVEPILLVISDNTHSKKQLSNSIKQGIVTGIIALLISEAILLFLLLGTIKRLISITEALKLLPKFEYTKANQLISNKFSLIKDEITSLESSTHFVTDELQLLHKNVNKNKLSLENKVKALARSRSFLSRLLDNSQLFIITQDFNNTILTRNQKMDEIIDTDDNYFLHCISANTAMDLYNSLTNLKNNKKEIVYHEGHSFDYKGNEVFISWTHSIVEDEEGEQVILSIGSDLTKRKEAEKALHWMANNDPLTGISNRRGFQQKLQQLIESEANFSLVFIDVDHFKQINDIHGHTAGDEVLIKIANQLKKVTRQTDYISRLAGDEFTILLTRTSLKELDEILKKVTSALQGQINFKQQKLIDFRTSLGAAVYPTHATDSETLIIYADMAMYHAKNKGDTSWHIFSEQDERLNILKSEHFYSNLIRNALKHNLFTLFFQPIMEINSQQTHHYEALLRIEKSDGSLTFPGEFIPIAEKNGLIRDIDKWVVDKALNILSKQLIFNEAISFAVNISAPSLQSVGLPDFIASALSKHHVPAQNLVIELTETAYIENFTQVLENLKTLNNLGVKVALDDFGVGFSSFNYLKRLPLSYVKLDGSYIKDLCLNTDDQAFVKSLSEMVQAFGMQTIAEFVEDQKTMELLEQLGVNYAQGYHIGRPQADIKLPEEVANL